MSTVISSILLLAYHVYPLKLGLRLCAMITACQIDKLHKNTVDHESKIKVQLDRRDESKKLPKSIAFLILSLGNWEHILNGIHNKAIVICKGLSGIYGE